MWFAEGVWRGTGEDVWEVLSAEAYGGQLQFPGQQLVLRLRAQRTKPLPGESRHKPSLSLFMFFIFCTVLSSQKLTVSFRANNFHLKLNAIYLQVFFILQVFLQFNQYI